MESVFKQAGRQPGSRNYQQSFKRQVAQAACEPDVSVSKLALSRGLNANQVFRWRRQYRAGQFGPADAGHVAAALAEVEKFHVVSVSEPAEPRVVPVMSAAESGRAAGAMRLRLPQGELTIEGAPDRETLELVLRCLMR